MIENIYDVSETDFNEKVIEASDNKLIVVDFWAPWCGPCKQLTPILEKVVTGLEDKIVLAKINIDENQQIAAQLRIQSIPAVFAFKNKQVVNAFQGVIPEKEIFKFLEDSLGEKLNNNFDSFFKEIETHLSNKDYTQAKELLENFISENSKEVKAIYFYAECLISMGETDVANEFLKSLDEDLINNDEIKKIIKRLGIIKQKNDGPSIDELNKDLLKSPKNLETVFKISETYFANNDFDSCFEILLKYYPTNKEKVKQKILNFFDVLGFKHESVILYRKKLSSMMFS